MIPRRLNKRSSQLMGSTIRVRPDWDDVSQMTSVTHHPPVPTARPPALWQQYMQRAFSPSHQEQQQQKSPNHHGPLQHMPTWMRWSFGVTNNSSPTSANTNTQLGTTTHNDEHKGAPPRKTISLGVGMGLDDDPTEEESQSPSRHHRGEVQPRKAVRLCSGTWVPISRQQ